MTPPPQTRHHLLPAAISLVIMLLAAFGFAGYARGVEAAHIFDIAPLHFNQKMQGKALESDALATDGLLCMYGSSEVQLQAGYLAPFHANTILKERPTGFTIFPIGKGGTSPLIDAEKLASVAGDLHGRNVVISISPVLFYGFGAEDPPDVYAGNFSVLHAYSVVFGQDISTDLRHQIVSRMLDYPDTVQQDPLLCFGAKNLNRGGVLGNLAYAAAWPIAQLRIAVLGLQDHYEAVQYIQHLDPATTAAPPPVSKTLDLAALAQRAQFRYQAWCANNSYGIDSDRWVSRYRQESEILHKIRANEHFRSDLDRATKWWTDLDLLLRLLNESGARALLISAPIDGKYMDYCGVSLADRQDYYNRIRALASKYGMAEVDFSDHDQDIYFATDVEAHLSPKGWIYYIAALDRFEHSQPLLDHTVPIPFTTSDVVFDDPPEYEGSVEHVGADGITGWAWDATHPNDPVTVELLDNNQIFASIKADQFSPDLVDAGRGNGKHAFYAPLPNTLRDGASHAVLGRVAGSDFYLSDNTFAFVATPELLTPAAANSILPQAADVMNDPGSLDEVTDQSIHGWAWDASRPNFSLTVELFDNQVAIGRFQADQPRDDLAAVGKGNGRHGFDIPTPASLKDGSPHSIGVGIVVQPPASPVMLNGSPKLVELGAPQTAPTSNLTMADDPGSLDNVDASGIQGWAWDPQNPNTPVQVEVFDGFTRIAVATADQERADLAAVGKGDGRHGFTIPLPDSLRDGATHQIDVRIKGTDIHLHGSPTSFVSK
jgi:D-alanine transfer protein